MDVFMNATRKGQRKISWEALVQHLQWYLYNTLECARALGPWQPLPTWLHPCLLLWRSIWFPKRFVRDLAVPQIDSEATIATLNHLTPKGWIGIKGIDPYVSMQLLCNRLLWEHDKCLGFRIPWWLQESTCHQYLVLCWLSASLPQAIIFSNQQLVRMKAARKQLLSGIMELKEEIFLSGLYVCCLFLIFFMPHSLFLLAR